MKAAAKKIVIIGAGPAGLAAALRLRDRGERDIVLLEREREPGGILRQCIHDGFGLTRFGETLSGPEYAARFTERAAGLGLEIVTGATVIGLTTDRVVTAATREGLRVYQAQAVILAMDPRRTFHPGATALRHLYRRGCPGLYESQKHHGGP